MRTVFLLLLSAVFSLNLSAQSDSFQKRVVLIDNFGPELNGIQASILSFQQDLEEIQNPKLIKKDIDSIDVIKMMVKKIESSIAESAYSINTRKSKTEIAELDKIITERAKYTNAEALHKQLEYGSNYSKKLNKLISSIKNKKYNQAKVLLYSLNSEEIIIAEKFEENDSFLLREKNMQEALKQSITKKKAEIEKTLSFPEKAIQNIRDQKQELELQKNIFKNIQKELSQIQFDIEFKTWSLGMFKCDQGASYLISLEHPNLMMLANDGNLKSVIKLDPTGPNSYDVAYACKKLGSFGSCLDNQSKELCRLDEECMGSLSEMEENYDRGNFFNLVKNVLPSGILVDQQMKYRDETQFNLLRGFHEEGRLGYFSLEELVIMIDPVNESIKTIESKNPEEHLKKIKQVIDIAKKRSILSIPKRSGSKPSSTKTEQTKRSLEYLYSAMNTSLETILSDDVIQNRVYADCDQALAEDNGFCSFSKAWREKVKVFERVKEVKNLTPEECPRGVFRLGQ